MTNHIDVTTLRDWLDQGKPVTVVDVRSADARTEWSIPGSVHVDAYADLRQGRPGPLATENLPADRFISTAPIRVLCRNNQGTDCPALRRGWSERVSRSRHLGRWSR
jgi:rhodanese-related sulfurtransferase